MKGQSRSQGDCLWFYYSMVIANCQEENLEVLEDKGRNEKDRPWAEHKMEAEVIAELYESIGNVRKAERVRNCATFLEWKVLTVDENVKKLHNANFCRVRLCPTCAWRRSLKTYGQMAKVMANIPDNYAYLHLVLTVRNVYGDQLREELDNLSKAWDRFSHYVAIKNVVKGYYRATEVSHNVKEKSPWYDTYHPHFHCLLAVNKSYFSGKTYLKKDKWIALWKKAARLNYDPNVFVERIKAKNPEKALAEISKYTTKFSEIILPDKWKLSEETVAVLDKALENKRFLALGGIFKEVHKKLNLDDMEDGDLVHVETDNIDDDGYKTVYYTWHSGYCQYIKEK